MAFKVKFRTLFPALVTAASPLTLVKTGLSYAFGIDINSLRASLGGVTSYNGRGGDVVATTTDVPLPNYLTGLTLSTAGSSATFGIAAGYAADTGNAALMNLASAYTKTTSAWAVGTATGSLDTGAIANNTWYHVFLIRRTDTGVVDVLISTSATTPTMPASYTQKRRIGSMRTNGSAQWIKFIQNGDDFTWDTPVADVSAATNPGTAAVTRTLTVPTGLILEAKIFIAGTGSLGDPGPGAIYVSDLAVSDNAAVIASFATINAYTPNSGSLTGQLGALARVFTNTSAQVRTRLQISNANIRLDMNTIGWLDRRGKDG